MVVKLLEMYKIFIQFLNTLVQRKIHSHQREARKKPNPINNFRRFERRGEEKTHCEN